MRSLREGNVFTRIWLSVCLFMDGVPRPWPKLFIRGPSQSPGPVGKQETGLQLKGLLSYHPSMKLREGNVCLSFCSGGPHMTITYDALNLTVEFPHPSLGPLEIRPGTLPGPDPGSGPSPLDIRHWTPWQCLLLVTSSGHHWIPVQTCLF